MSSGAFLECLSGLRKLMHLEIALSAQDAFRLLTTHGPHPPSVPWGSSPNLQKCSLRSCSSGSRAMTAPRQVWAQRRSIFHLVAFSQWIFEPPIRSHSGEVSFPYICLAMINVWIVGMVFFKEKNKIKQLQRERTVPTRGLTTVISHH